MATNTIRKVSHEGIGYCVVEPNGVRHVFAAAVPHRGNTLREQAEDALRTIEAVNREEGAAGAIVHQAVFLKDLPDLDEARWIIRAFYGADLPATSYVMQPPCAGKRLAIEALGIGRGSGIDRPDFACGALGVRRIAAARPVDGVKQGPQRPGLLRQRETP